MTAPLCSRSIRPSPSSILLSLIQSRHNQSDTESSQGQLKQRSQAVLPLREESQSHRSTTPANQDLRSDLRQRGKTQTRSPVILGYSRWLARWEASVSVVHVGKPHPRKSRSFVQIPASRTKARAAVGQSSGSRGMRDLAIVS